jgi:hypothetical protein
VSTLGDQLAPTAVRSQHRHVSERTGVNAVDDVSARESGTINAGAFVQLCRA